MLKVKCPNLTTVEQTLLAKRKKKQAKWDSLGRPETARAIRDKLRQAFHHKCGYCEDKNGRSIDHFWPQSAFSDKRWDWDNYIWACDVCQSSKLAQAPAEGEVTMLNPRADEPLNSLYFDSTTGRCTHLNPQGELTVQCVGLNRNFPTDLSEQRYKKFLRVMHFVIAILDAQSSTSLRTSAWERLQEELAPQQEYLALIRQILRKPDATTADYKSLFDELRQLRPEFGKLIQDWCLPLEIEMA